MLVYFCLICCIFVLPFSDEIMLYTEWLKLKYPTGQNAISRQP